MSARIKPKKKTYMIRVSERAYSYITKLARLKKINRIDVIDDFVGMRKEIERN